MAGPCDIFAKRRLTARQLRSVAERRHGDAKCLLDSGDTERANGAVYMAGFAIECLLKAMLLDRHPNLGLKLDPAKLSATDRDVYTSLYGHDLDDMVAFLPELRRKLSGLRTRSGRDLWLQFQAICEQWTVYARYAPSLIKLEDAVRYLETVREVKQWLR